MMFEIGAILIALFSEPICHTGNSDYDNGREDEREAIKERLMVLQSADKQGSWVETKIYVHGEPKIAVECSECKWIPLWMGSPILPTNDGNLDHCPHCGMGMKGDKDDA